MSCLINVTSFVQAFALLAQDGDAPLLVQILNNPLTPLVGVVALFYFILILPERRRRADEAKLLAAIKKNDRVVTVGGIHATVVAAAPESKVITLKIDESGSTRIKVNRSAIATVLTDKSKDADASSSKELQSTETNQRTTKGSKETATKDN